MKLVRFGPRGRERPGVWIDAPAGGTAEILDVRAMAFDIEDYNSRFFACFGIDRLRRLLAESGRKTVSAEGMRLGPPVARPGKIVCLGKNYAAHVAEFDAAMPSSPIVFCKASSAIAGPFDEIVLPRCAGPVDWEVELAAVIGRQGRRISEAQALEYVAGYTILNDVTDRCAQQKDGQWFRAKSADTFCPLGPFLVTADEAGDASDLALSSRLNGEVFQNGRTSQMIFGLPKIISFISETITLEPGDIIATGTPAGIGTKRAPPVSLKPGDVVELEVERLGSQRNAVVLESE